MVAERDALASFAQLNYSRALARSEYPPPGRIGETTERVPFRQRQDSREGDLAVMDWIRHGALPRASFRFVRGHVESLLVQTRSKLGWRLGHPLMDGNYFFGNQRCRTLSDGGLNLGSSSRSSCGHRRRMSGNRIFLGRSNTRRSSRFSW